MGLNRRSFLRALVGVPFGGTAIAAIIARGGASTTSPVKPPVVVTGTGGGGGTGVGAWATDPRNWTNVSVWNPTVWITKTPLPTEVTWHESETSPERFGWIARPDDIVFVEGRPIGHVTNVCVSGSSGGETNSQITVALTPEGEAWLAGVMVRIGLEGRGPLGPQWVS